MSPVLNPADQQQVTVVGPYLYSLTVQGGYGRPWAITAHLGKAMLDAAGAVQMEYDHPPTLVEAAFQRGKMIPVFGPDFQPIPGQSVSSDVVHAAMKNYVAHMAATADDADGSYAALVASLNQAP